MNKNDLIAIEFIPVNDAGLKYFAKEQIDYANENNFNVEEFAKTHNLVPQYGTPYLRATEDAVFALKEYTKHLRYNNEWNLQISFFKSNGEDLPGTQEWVKKVKICQLSVRCIPETPNDPPKTMTTELKRKLLSAYFEKGDKIQVSDMAPPYALLAAKVSGVNL